MIAQELSYIDGQWYQPGEEIWDLGSFVCIPPTEANGTIRHYHGLSKDISKLPHYVESGSTAFCLDNNSYYEYHKQTDTWYKIA